MPIKVHEASECRICHKTLTDRINNPFFYLSIGKTCGKKYGMSENAKESRIAKEEGLFKDLSYDEAFKIHKAREQYLKDSRKGKKKNEEIASKELTRYDEAKTEDEKFKIFYDVLDKGTPTTKFNFLDLCESTESDNRFDAERTLNFSKKNALKLIQREAMKNNCVELLVRKLHVNDFNPDITDQDGADSQLFVEALPYLSNLKNSNLSAHALEEIILHNNHKIELFSRNPQVHECIKRAMFTRGEAMLLNYPVDIRDKEALGRKHKVMDIVEQGLIKDMDKEDEEWVQMAFALKRPELTNKLMRSGYITRLAEPLTNKVYQDEFRKDPEFLYKVEVPEASFRTVLKNKIDLNDDYLEVLRKHPNYKKEYEG